MFEKKQAFLVLLHAVALSFCVIFPFSEYIINNVAGIIINAPYKVLFSGISLNTRYPAYAEIINSKYL